MLVHADIVLLDNSKDRKDETSFAGTKSTLVYPLIQFCGIVGIGVAVSDAESEPGLGSLLPIIYY